MPTRRLENSEASRRSVRQRTPSSRAAPSLVSAAQQRRNASTRPTLAEQVAASGLLAKMARELENVWKGCAKLPHSVSALACALAIRRGEFPVDDSVSVGAFGLDLSNNGTRAIQTWSKHIDEWHAIHPEDELGPDRLLPRLRAERGTLANRYAHYNFGACEGRWLIAAAA